MKETVIDFLANGKGTPQEKFNKALELYRKTKDHDPQVLRFNNQVGFTPARLEDLTYELKKANKVTDLEVSSAKKRPARKKEAPVKSDRENLLDYIGNVNQVDLAVAKDEAIAEIVAKSIELILKVPEEERTDAVITEYLVKLQNFVMARELEIFNDFFGISKTSVDDQNPDLEIVDNNKENLQVNANHLGSEATKKQLDDHIDANQIEVFDAKDISKFDTNVSENDTDVSKNETSGDVQPADTPDNTPETIVEKTGSVSEAVQKEIDEAEEEVKKVMAELETIDLEKSSYNDIKSFAARLAKVIDTEPKDQKSATLKPFIEEARKKHFPGK